MSEGPVNRPSFLWRLIYFIFYYGIRISTHTILTACIAAVALISIRFTFSFEAIWTAAGLMTYAIILLTSSSVRNFIHQNDFVGYWKYTNRPEPLVGDKNFDQAEDTTRIVKIDRADGQLRFTMWRADNFKWIFSESEKVIITNFGKKSGELFYWYKSTADAPSNQCFSGMVYIKCKKDYSTGLVSHMPGKYFGDASKSIGTVSYCRISEEEFMSYRGN